MPPSPARVQKVPRGVMAVGIDKISAPKPSSISFQLQRANFSRSLHSPCSCPSLHDFCWQNSVRALSRFLKKPAAIAFVCPKTN